jgi:hypothetical protein
MDETSRACTRFGSKPGALATQKHTKQLHAAGGSEANMTAGKKPAESAGLAGKQQTNRKQRSCSVTAQQSNITSTLDKHFIALPLKALTWESFVPSAGDGNNSAHLHTQTLL